MELFPFSQYTYLANIFEPGYCNDGIHVQDEVFACDCSLKALLVEEATNRAAVVHDNGDSQFRGSYKMKIRGDRVYEAVVRARQERSNVTFVDDPSQNWKNRRKLGHTAVS